MRFANWADGQFVNASSMNATESLTEQSFGVVVNGLHTPGLFNTVSSGSIAGLVFTITLNDPFGIVFGPGIVAQAWGAVDGVENHTYITNFSSLIPGSGSVTAYLIASLMRIAETPQEIVGPPLGHPDYDPAFAPFVSYSEIVDSIALTASLTPADNYATFEICRFTLIAGQTVLNPGDFGHQIRAGAVLSRNGEVLTSDLAVTGVTAGTYFPPSITVGVDGRLTAASRQLVGSSDLTITGVAAGTYFPASVTVGVDGRLTAAARQLVASSDLTTTGVTATTYRIPQMTVDAAGRVTAASPVLVGTSDMTTTGVGAGTYLYPQFTVGVDGRLTAATSFAGSIGGNPNGLVAGSVGTISTPPMLLFDYVNQLVWECTSSGSSSTAVWKVVSGTQGGWHTLISNTSVTTPNWAAQVEAQVVGGGGGGSNCLSTAPYSSSTSSGAGGGAGGFAWGVYAVTPGQVLNAVVGGGGGPQATGATTFITGLLTATGGTGGFFQSGNSSAGGAGGIGSGGTIINSNGTFGSDGQAGAFVFAGNGGPGPWGGGGRAGNGAGFNGSGPGSGGGGAYDASATGNTKIGGSGFQGIILYRFLSPSPAP